MSDPKQKPQREKFIEKARELETDENEETFEERLKRLSTQKTKKEEASDE